MKEKKMGVKCVVSKGMDMCQLREKAKNLGVKTGKMKKTELIHAIQNAEGFTACFGKSNGYCSQEACCFRYDCLKTSV
jgi:hypothetical protein